MQLTDEFSIDRGVAQNFIRETVVEQKGTEFYARALLNNITSDVNNNNLLASILAANNVDGGFASQPSGDSNAYDTAWALQSLAKVNPSHHSVNAAILYLINNVNADGGWGYPDGESSVYVTALILKVMAYFEQQFDLTTLIENAESFLLSQRVGNLWGEDFLSAQALLSLNVSLANPLMIEDSLTALSDRQLANGSWSNDVFSTALALQALGFMRDVPSNLQTGTIIGSVVDGLTGNPIQGVSIEIVGSTNSSNATTADGKFTISDLAPGSYDFSVLFSGYGSVGGSVEILAGQTVDFGVIQLIQGQIPTLATVYGVVLDADTGLPIVGANIDINAGQYTAVSNLNGAYQISGISPQAISVDISIAGYSSSTSNFNAVAGGLYVLSPALVPTVQPNTGLRGVITDAVTGNHLPGALVSLSGSSSASTFSDSSGNYTLNNIIPGNVLVTVSLEGYDNVVTSTILYENNIVEFSPKLYLENSTPSESNTSSLTGIVIDSTTNAPLANVSVEADFGSQSFSLLTDANGVFTISEITNYQGNVAFSISDYNGAMFGVQLNPLENFDLGQVRLRPLAVTELLPDLVVGNINATSTMTNLATLELTGELLIDVVNQGTSIAVEGVQVTAFHDVNNNGAYDQNTDTLLATAFTNNSLDVGNSEELTLNLQGALPYRDATVKIWVDSLQTAIEISEENNVTSVSNSCQLTPPLESEFDPIVKWHWADFNVLSTPVVAPIVDTNLDGLVDTNDDIVVLVNAFAVGTSVDGAPSVIKALDGRTGNELWTVGSLTGTYRFRASASIGVADINNDGSPEILGYLIDGNIAAFDNQQQLLWVTNSLTNAEGFNYGAINFADLDGDGSTEILARETILSADGSVLWTSPKNHWNRTSSFAVDIDLDGDLEVIIGGTVFDHIGNELFELAGYTGLVAVANFDGDDFPEFAVKGTQTVSLFDHLGNQIWGPVAIPGGGHGGSPTIGDMDGDGLPEIGVAGRSFYTVYDTDGSILWSSPTSDGSQTTGSSVFDFNGDGKFEVLYSDERNFQIYDGETGAADYLIRNLTSTAAEYPIVADIDSDGHAELLVVADIGTEKGIRAIEDRNDTWVATRKLWNQYNYHIDNINEDLSIPVSPEKGWLTHNTYRFNTIPNGNPLGAPDLTIAKLEIIDNGGGQSLSAQARVGNAGVASSPNNIVVSIYSGDPVSGGSLLGSTQLDPLPAQSYVDIVLNNLVLPSDTNEVFALVDVDNLVEECNESNNSVSTTIPLTTLANIQVNTNATVYGPGGIVELSAVVNNLGSLSGEFKVGIQITDLNGNLVIEFPAQLTNVLSNGAQFQLNQNWDIVNIVADTYLLNGILFSLDGEIIDTATSQFSVSHSLVGDPTANLRTTTDKQNYHTTDTVQLENLVQNITTNVFINEAILNVIVLDPLGVNFYQQATPISSLNPSGLAQLYTPLILDNAAIGIYSIQANVIDAFGNILATDTAGFIVNGDLRLALLGSVTAQFSAINVGETQECIDEFINQSSSGITNYSIRQLLTNITTQTEVDENIQLLDLAVNDTTALSRTINTENLVQGFYACVTQVDVDGEWITLAADYFEVLNQAPIAEAGTYAPVFVGNVINLNGSQSIDPDGDALTYSWTIINAPAASSSTIQNATEVNASYILDVRGTYEVQLTVSDGKLTSSDIVVLDTLNNPPIANAGNDQAAFVGATLTLDASASTDVDGDPLSYQWQLIQQPPTSTATLSDPTAVMPQITIDEQGTYIVELIVNDGINSSSADSVTLTINNIKPIANAGQDQSGFINNAVTLDGSASSDADGDALTYFWTLLEVPVNSTATLSDPTNVMPSLMLDEHGDYRVQLIVNDGIENSDPDEVVVSTLNIKPVADAGADKFVFVNDLLTLSGSGSYDADGDPISYQWSIVSKPAASAAVLLDANTETPIINIDTAGVYVVQLIVNDGIDNSDPDTVVLTTQNVRPIADAGSPQLVDINDLVTLDGSSSSDPDGDVITFLWSVINQPSGSSVTFSDSTIVNPTFTPLVDGLYVIQLTVNDGDLTSAPATVTITVENPIPPLDCSQAGVYPNEMWPPNHKFQEVTVQGLEANTVIRVTSITQDEPIGDKKHSPDAQIEVGEVGESDRIYLRREREGNLHNGRVYQINFDASNALGGQCSGSVNVVVPHDQSHPVVDDGQLYNSLGQ